MIELKNIIVSINYGISACHQDKFILPSITFRSMATTAGCILGLGWWKYRLSFMFQKQSGSLMLEDKF